jgi:hypothetical protein
MAVTPPTNEGDGFATFAPLATAAIGVFTAVTAGLATVGGASERVLRNHGGEASIGLAAIAIALALSAGATVIRDWPYVRSNSLLRYAIGVVTMLALAVGLVFTGAAAVQTARDRSEPNIGVDVKEDSIGTRVEVVVASHGVRNAEHLQIRGYPVRVSSSGERVRENAVYLAHQGPDTAGDVNVKFSIAPMDRYQFVLIVAWPGEDMEPDCNSLLRDPHRVLLGCVLVPLPGQDQMPRLNVSNQGDATSGLLTVKVKQSGLAMGQSISLRVVGTVGAKVDAVIYQALLRPDRAGNVDESLTVALPKDASAACIAARTGSTWTNPACPPDFDSTTAWAQILVR